MVRLTPNIILGICYSGIDLIFGGLGGSRGVSDQFEVIKSEPGLAGEHPTLRPRRYKSQLRPIAEPDFSWHCGYMDSLNPKDERPGPKNGPEPRWYPKFALSFPEVNH